MKRLLVFAAIAMMIASCGKSPVTQTEIAQPQPLLTVERARELVDRQLAQTRTRTRPLPENYEMNRALPGEFEVLWETAVESANERIEAVEVKIKAQYRYVVLHYAQKHVVPIEQRLLIISRRDTLNPSSCIATIMPMKGSTAADYHHTDDSSNFSGYVMFKKLNGQFFQLTVYEHGKRTLNLLEDWLNPDEEISRQLLEISKRYKIFGAPNVETKSCVVCYDPELRNLNSLLHVWAEGMLVTPL